LLKVPSNGAREREEELMRWMSLVVVVVAFGCENPSPSPKPAEPVQATKPDEPAPTTPPATMDRCGDGTCGDSETRANCCEDCGCGSGESCQAGSCEATCGDGVCSAADGENLNNCCTDCGCAEGSSCVSNRCNYVGTATLDWTTSDGCLSGQTTYFKFFDVDNGSESEQFYVTSGSSYTVSLTCTAGDRICFGARQGSSYWGVDIDNSKACTDCCAFCTDGVVKHTLTCN
jgi:hypothetical protein